MSETKSSQRFHSLNAEQVEVLHQVLSEVVPIHGRGNFPTLELRPRDIIIAVRARLQKQGITVRDVRLNGSTASHVLVRDNGTSYKDLDIIFGVELPNQEEFQVIKESVLGCLLDCLPAGVNRERISSATMKEAYVQKMVKVFNEHDRWSLISLSNNSGKNLELKFVSALRRQFEFSVDSFQILLDRLLESYMQQESQHKTNTVGLKERPAESQNKGSQLKQATGAEREASAGRDKSSTQGAQQREEVHEKESQTDLSQQKEPSNQTTHSKVEEEGKQEKTAAEPKEESEPRENTNGTHSPSHTASEKTQTSEETETPAQTQLRHEPQLPDETASEQSQQPAHSNLQEEPSSHTNPRHGEEDATERSKCPQTSQNAEAEAVESHTTEHSDETDFPECSGEDQRSKEKDQRQHMSSPETIASPPAAEETRPADERNVETETREQIEAESKSRSESGRKTEEILAAEAKSVENSLGTDCSCALSSISPTFHNKPEIQSTENSEKSHNILDGPPDTQDNSPAPTGLVSDSKTSSSSKASERLSHMVVLKHSSPKPPRRMCRKVAPSPYPGPDSNPCPSPEPEMTFDPETTAPSSDPATSATTAISAKTNPGPEPDTSTDPTSRLDLTSAPDPTSEIVPDPTALPQESSQPITEGPLDTDIQSPKETPAAHPAFDEHIHDSVDSEPKEPEHTSDVDLSDGDETREQQTKKMDLCQLSSPSPPVTCLTPPMLSLSPPCFTPSPPSLSPPPCPTTPPHCLSPLNTENLASSFSSPPLSFSPTSSCLSSHPYLTPPMLSLSPPPLCLTPPSPCLSPPFLCLTPPAESEDLVAQVSSDTEPLILNTDGEGQMEESSPQPRVSLLQSEDKKDQDLISSQPRVAEPVSFPITIPSSSSHVLPPSQPAGPGEAAPPKAHESSSSEPANKEAPEVTADMPGQSSAPCASGSVPAVEVLAESMYGDFEAAMDHLRYRLIATRNPEEIRGGGLLKYSNLLVRDYRPASETQIKTLERYMCSRFFIDFPDVQEQQRKILSYLKNHFIGEERSKYQYLMTLRRVVDDSTVCLMGHERRQTLNMITVLALKVLGEQNIIPNTDHVTCFYQPAPYLAEHSAPYLAEPSYCSYYIPQGGSTLLYQPYPLHLHSQTGLV